MPHSSTAVSARLSRLVITCGIPPCLWCHLAHSLTDTHFSQLLHLTLLVQYFFFPTRLNERLSSSPSHDVTFICARDSLHSRVQCGVVLSCVRETPSPLSRFCMVWCHRVRDSLATLMVRYSALPPPIVKLAGIYIYMLLSRRFAHGIRIVGEPIWSGVGTLAVWGPTDTRDCLCLYLSE